MELKKIIEKPVNEEELSKLKWLYRGITALNERTRKDALESDIDFMEKEGKYMTPEEFHSVVFSRPLKKISSSKYKGELERYHSMFLNNISEILEINFPKGAEIGKTIGIPNAKENLFELKKSGKRLGFVHLDEESKTIDFVTELEDLPTHFRKKIDDKK